MWQLPTHTIARVDTESIFEVEQMRCCTKCVYAKWMSNKVYCMFFTAPSCPKGSGDLHFSCATSTKKLTRQEPEKPPYPAPVEGSRLSEFHYEIYFDRYENGKLLREIAEEYGVTYPAITQYMDKCDRKDLENGHTKWSEWKQKHVRKPEKAGLTPAGNIPPPPLSPKTKKRFENHPLRINHDAIFTMLGEGYSKKDIAEQLGLNLNSLYGYIQRCEDNWDNL